MQEQTEHVTAPVRKAVFFVSDGTGITAEALGRSLLTQFPGVAMRKHAWPFIDSPERAAEVVERINAMAREEGQPPLVFSTLVDHKVREVVAASEGVFIDFFATFNPILERALKTEAVERRGQAHGVGDYQKYGARIDALNFSLSNDDGGTGSNYPAADVIIIGVSRSGKTPTSLHLALQYGVLAANYPLTENDLEAGVLPQHLRPFRDKLFGLTIDPERLHRIRGQRFPGSRYAAYDQCLREVQAMEGMLRRERVRFVNTTSKSIEEIAATILQTAGLERRLG